MDDWGWVGQSSVAALGVVMFLRFVADALEVAKTDLTFRKAAWDREQRRKLEEDSEMIVAEVVSPGTMSAPTGDPPDHPVT